VRRSILLALVLVGASGSFSKAAVVTSTSSGGDWNDGATWVGGVAPGAADDVIVVGPVGVTGSAACLTLSVGAPGSVYNAAVTPASLVVGDDVVNEGEITDGGQVLTLAIGGDITNTAVWSNANLVITGTAERHLAMDAAATFVTNLSFDPAATGDLVVDTPLVIDGNVDAGEGRLVLAEDTGLTLLEGFLAGNVAANDNEIRFESWSYLVGITLDAAVLVGTASVRLGGTFTGGLTVMDHLSNTPTGGSAHILVEGPLVNHGTITNDTYGFTIALEGDLENHGMMDNSYVAFQGTDPRLLSMGPDGVISTSVFLPEFEAGSIVATTDLRFDDGALGLGVSGTLTLAPGSTASFSGHGGLGGGTVEAYAASIEMDDGASFSGSIVEAATLRGTINVVGDLTFTEGVTLVGTLQTSPVHTGATVIVHGTLLNEGVITETTQPLVLDLRGHVVNLGTWNNGSAVVDGDDDRIISVGPGIDVPSFMLASGLDAAPFQWYRDGVPIPGETSTDLVFVTIDAGDAGLYHCEDAVASSRTFTVEEGTVVATPDIAPVSGLAVEPVYPNPFRGAPSIAFTLHDATSVQVAVYDVAGREVSVLVEGHRAAGRHVATWDTRDAPPGTYFLRARARGVEEIRRLVCIR
jgi:hypothetical protein